MLYNETNRTGFWFIERVKLTGLFLCIGNKGMIICDLFT